MTKSIVVYAVSFLLLFLASLFLHQFILDTQSISLRFKLIPVYVFFVLVSFLICVVFKSFTYFEKTKEKLGFLYLFTLFIKIILFSIIFYKSIVVLKDISKIESFNLLIPLFIFLALEVTFVAGILNQKSY
jgi:hypothetical protein